MKSKFLLLLTCPVAIASFGCSGDYDYKYATTAEAPSQDYLSESSNGMASSESMAGESTRGIVAGKTSSSGTSAIVQVAADREIIYTATIRLAVDDFDSFPERLAIVSQAVGGFIAETDVARMQGTRRSGRWIVRVPGATYQDFIRDVSGLGVPESVQEKADDVTEQFVDLQARIKSAKQLEEQIIKLLEQQNDKIENVLVVERELSRVRLEIEQQEGRMRYLQNQVAMSTITIHASEQRTFTPEQAKTLSERISLEWQNAIQRAKDFFEDALVWTVANGIVIIAWIVGLAIAWFLVFRRIWWSMKKIVRRVLGGSAETG